jgi:hypothetical protein
VTSTIFLSTPKRWMSRGCHLFCLDSEKVDVTFSASRDARRELIRMASGGRRTRGDTSQAEETSAARLSSTLRSDRRELAEVSRVGFGRSKQSPRSMSDVPVSSPFFRLSSSSLESMAYCQTKNSARKDANAGRSRRARISPDTTKITHVIPK